jgi:hypothetical protein
VVALDQTIRMPGCGNLVPQRPRRIGLNAVGRSSLLNFDPLARKGWLEHFRTLTTPQRSAGVNCYDWALTEQGSNQTGTLTAASRVCGRTDEGRLFRIDFHGIGDNAFRTTVIVWNK